MAIQWLWKDKCGEMIYSQDYGKGENEFAASLYEGNAFLIFIDEWEEDGENRWQMHDFWADETHMKNCLGLSKGYKDNIYENSQYQTIKKFRFNKAKCKHLKKIVPALTQAFDNITIEIYTEEADEKSAEKGA